MKKETKLLLAQQVEYLFLPEDVCDVLVRHGGCFYIYEVVQSPQDELSKWFEASGVNGLPCLKKTLKKRGLRIGMKTPPNPRQAALDVIAKSKCDDRIKVLFSVLNELQRELSCQLDVVKSLGRGLRY